MKITARQLKEYDTFDQNYGVVSAVLDRSTNMMKVELISSAGNRSKLEIGPNTVLHVLRDDEQDPLNNPYWWGMEAERDRLEDLRAESEQDAAIMNHYATLEAQGVYV